MRILPVSLLLASLAPPAAAESRFGLGLDLLFEHQESLEISAFRGTILTRDLLNGGEQSAEQPSDPELLNRKFDLVWELEGTGVELPIELPGFGGLDPRLVLQAGVADVSLDFIGLRDRRDDAALSGRGPLFGAELEVEGSPWGSSPWSLGGSLRWQKVPSLTMDRSPTFRLEGFEAIGDGVQLSRQEFEVIGDDVGLEQEVEEFTTRVAYSASSGRTKTYLGVRHRRSDLRIEDELSYVDPLGEIETRLASRTELNSETTLALAGVESRLNDRLYARVETAVGEGDLVVQASIRYLWPPGISPEREKIRRRANEIAREIVGPLQELEASLEQWRVCLEQGTCGAAEFVTQTEKDLLAILSATELAGYRDWVREEFQKLRQAENFLGSRVALASSSRGRAQLRLTEGRTAILAVFELVFVIVQWPRRQAEDNDLLATLCLRSKPSVADIVFWPKSDRTFAENGASPGEIDIYRGLYTYGAKKSPHRSIGCLPEEPLLRRCSTVNLVTTQFRAVFCDFGEGLCRFAKEKFHGCST